MQRTESEALIRRVNSSLCYAEQERGLFSFFFFFLELLKLDLEILRTQKSEGREVISIDYKLNVGLDIAVISRITIK